jgi:hypothetical protein
MVKKLKIYLDTAIPSKNGGTYFLFERSMLYTPAKTDVNSKEGDAKKVNIENRADLSREVCYRDDKLYPNLRANEMLEFLFNDKKFEKILGPENTTLSEVERLPIQKSNIMTTLKCLFPVGYPVINDINDSYSMLNNGSDMNTLWFNPFKDYTSYIKLSGSPYTIQRVIWINDGYNFNKAVNDYKLTNRITESPNVTDYYVYKETVSGNVNIIVAIDLIKGELNAKEKKDIACPFTGEVLGTKLDNFVHSQDYDKRNVQQGRLLFDIPSKKGIQGTTQTVNTSTNSDIDKQYNAEIEKWIDGDTTRQSKADKRKAYENLNILFNKISNNAAFKDFTSKTTGYNTRQTIYDILDKVGNYKSSRGIDFFYYLNLVASKDDRVISVDDNDIIDFAKDIVSSSKKNIRNELKQLYNIILRMMVAVEEEAGSSITVPIQGGSTHKKTRNHNRRRKHKKTRKYRR